jgi:hypothetical protein
MILEMWQRLHKVRLQKNKAPCKSQELYQSPVGRKLTRDSTKHLESCLKELVSQGFFAAKSFSSSRTSSERYEDFHKQMQHHHMSSSLYKDLQEIVVVHFDVEKEEEED